MLQSAADWHNAAWESFVVYTRRTVPAGQQNNFHAVLSCVNIELIYVYRISDSFHFAATCLVNKKDGRTSVERTNFSSPIVTSLFLSRLRKLLICHVRHHHEMIPRTEMRCRNLTLNPPRGLCSIQLTVFVLVFDVFFYRATHIP